MGAKKLLSDPAVKHSLALLAVYAAETMNLKRGQTQVRHLEKLRTDLFDGIRQLRYAFSRYRDHKPPAAINSSAFAGQALLGHMLPKIRHLPHPGSITCARRLITVLGR
jgi:hypothetical protein